MVSKFSQWFLKLKDIKQVVLSFHVICRIRRVVLLYLQSGLELNLNRIHRNHLKIQLGKRTSFFLGMLTTYSKFKFQASNEKREPCWLGDIHKRMKILPSYVGKIFHRP